MEVDETSPLYQHDEKEEKDIIEHASPLIIPPRRAWGLWGLLYALWYLPTRFVAISCWFIFKMAFAFLVNTGIVTWFLAFWGKRKNVAVELVEIVENSAAAAYPVKEGVLIPPAATPSVSFAGGGMLWTYYLGVAHYIYKTFDTSKIKVFCSSAGTFGGVPLVMGLDPYKWCERDWHTCLEHFASRSLGPLFDSAQFYMKLWDAYLPADAHIRASGRLFISITTFPWLQNKVVSQFATREELIACIVASSCFPVVFVRSMPRTSYGLAFDGGLTNDQPCLNDSTVTVSCLNERADIHPEERFSVSDIIRVPNFKRVWTVANAAFEDAAKSKAFSTSAWNSIRL